MSGTTITMIRRGDTLAPTTEFFRDDLRNVSEGKEVLVTIKEARRPEQHRWFWAMLTAVCRSGTWDGDAESLLRYIKLRVGYGDWFPTTTGEAVFVPKSISFAGCDQTTFRRFLFFAERALAVHLGVDTGAVFAEADREAGPLEQKRKEAA